MNAPEPRPLSELVYGMPLHAAPPSATVSGITLDSRRVRRGDLFLAVPGRAGDGRDHIAAALEAGAVAVLAEAPFRAEADQPVAVVDGLARYAGELADRFFGQPSRRLCVIGITGTNGKTTCSHLLAQAFDRLGMGGAVMGTLGVGRCDELRPSALTTADVVTVHAELARLAAAGIRFVAMEVSSHALDQGRVDKVAFDVAVFTNLSQDHLDYHDDMNSYGRAKARLFAVPDLAACVVNADDAFGRRLATELGEGGSAGILWTFGESADCRVRRTGLTLSAAGIGMAVDVDGQPVEVRCALTGRFNADNVLAVLTTLVAIGVPAARAASALAGVRPVPGRMERFDSADGVAVVIDYAHTPDALEKALAACREHADGALWVVFGCGGDRDRGKRPLMGRVASRCADHVVVTSDNPRSEDPLAIIDEIRRGCDGQETVVEDRAAAIAHAITRAAPGDCVLVAGKGHETGQVLGGQTLPFSDRECVRGLLGGAS